MNSVTQIPPQVEVPKGTQFVERFEHDGVEVTVVEDETTHRFLALFADTRPTPFRETSMRLEDVRQKAMKLIDKLHGNK